MLLHSVYDGTETLYEGSLSPPLTLFLSFLPTLHDPPNSPVGLLRMSHILLLDVTAGVMMRFSTFGDRVGHVMRPIRDILLQHSLIHLPILKFADRNVNFLPTQKKMQTFPSAQLTCGQIKDVFVGSTVNRLVLPR